MTLPETPDWSPFWVAARDQRAEAPRSIDSVLGVGDRLRAAAFAELQALHAFRWAAATYEDAPPELREAWLRLALEEEKHLGWLLERLRALGFRAEERRVSDQLWVSLVSAPNAEAFALFMASAEERGQRAGERFHAQMKSADPESARIFGQIAQEEQGHIALARRWYPA